MNEVAANRITNAEGETTNRKPFLPRAEWSFVGYSVLAAVLCAGWILRTRKLVDPNEGLGYWLGIVGGTLMLLLLFYPAGKKSQLMRRLGLVKHWFRIHMIFGLVGPLLILYHCNFSVEAINSQVSLYAMLAVAGSGIVGRYFYARIHRGLYGKRTSIEELRAEISDAKENSRGLAAILPRFFSVLHSISAELLGNKFTGTMGVRKSLIWSVKHFYIRAKLFVCIKNELRERAIQSDTIRQNSAEVSKIANQYAKSQVSLMRRVAQLSFYERLFSLWHIFHMPLFLLLVVSALVHVLAVHMY